MTQRQINRLIDIAQGISIDRQMNKRTRHYAFILNKNITDVKVQQKSVKVWINLSYGSLKDPNNITKNVSNIGHLGNGDYEVLIKEDSYLDAVFDLIKQSYEMNKE